MDSTDWAFYAVSIVTATVVSIVVFRIFAILSSARAINEKNVLERKHTSKSKGDGGQPIRVAIIGAGVGGTSAAYFLKDLLGDNADVHVYSDGKVGGRTAVVEVDGRSYEGGGSVLHKDNMYMAGFAEKFGLTRVFSSSEGNMGIFDGYKFLFCTSSIGLCTKIHMLLRYGLSPLKLNSAVSDLLDKFVNIYKVQQKGQSFKTVPDMLSAMGDEDQHLTQVTALEYFESELKWNKRLVDELITSAMTVNYGQTCGVNAFVAMVSLAGVQSHSLWSVLGGNFLIAQECLKKSGAQFHSAKVTSVLRETDGNGTVKYNLSCTNLSAEGKETDTTDTYDAVILAAPLFNCGINFEGFDKPIYTKTSTQSYHQTVATFVKGELNPVFFGQSSIARSFPISILGVEQKNKDAAINSVAVQVPVDVKEKDLPKYLKPLTVEPTRVWKVFSNSPLSDDALAKIFTKFERGECKIWRAYPDYHPPQDFTPFALDEGKLFYVNCIEKAASAMEMSVIAAKNCTLLLDEAFQTL
jgi:prenylcysteine oxidase/farnesylcysteine lyase